MCNWKGTKNKPETLKNISQAICEAKELADIVDVVHQEEEGREDLVVRLGHQHWNFFAV